MKPPSDVDRALSKAEAAVRKYEAEGYRRGSLAPDEALEEVLGPLDWSFDGEGYRLLRRLLRRLEA